MKQIRLGVFETNSSTQHSLVFAYGSENQDLKVIIGSDTLKFGVRTAKEIDRAHKNTVKNWLIDIDKSFSWQDRADILFWRLLSCSSSAAEFILIQNKIIQIFKERGIKTVFLIDQNREYIESEFYDNYLDSKDAVNSKLLGWKDPEFNLYVINFIFSPYIIEYSYADDCISFAEIKKDIDELLSEFPENAQGFQKTDRS